MQDFRRIATLRPVITATALVALAGTSFAFAQHGFGRGNGVGDDEPRFEQRHRLSAADVSAFADARIAALKAGLQLTPDQAKNWPPFEQAVRDLVQLRIERLQARQAADQQQPVTPFERLSRRADTMAKSSAALKKIADAGAPLYQSLNDDQKGRFVRLARMLRPRHHMHGDHYRGWREDRRDG
jgi:LTXXQ motif family protein